MALKKLWNCLVKMKKAPYSVTNTTEGNPPANKLKDKFTEHS